MRLIKEFLNYENKSYDTKSDTINVLIIIKILSLSILFCLINDLKRLFKWCENYVRKKIQNKR